MRIWPLGLALATFMLVAGCGAADSTPTSKEGLVRRAEAREVREIKVPGAVLEVVLEGAVDEQTEAFLSGWIRRAASAVVSYYGEFPVERARIRIFVFNGRGIGGGRVVLEEIPAVHIKAGRFNDAIVFENDWKMTHEMTHMAFPRVGERHHWIEEGLATYVEPVARARIGWLTEEKVAAEWTSQMEKGQPEEGAEGLDRTDTWAATYWGGALFALSADVEIRERTGNRYGLRDALIAIVRAGGTLSAEWEIERALAVGDQAVGVPVLSEHYARMARQRGTVDLAAIWRKLGISGRGKSAVLEKTGSAAALRRAILSP